MPYDERKSENTRVRREVLKPDLTERGLEFFKMSPRGAYTRFADPHIHDAIECIYINRGSVIVYIDGKEERLRQGDLVLFRSMGIHSIYTEGEAENDYYVLKVATKLLYDISPKTLSGKFALRFVAYNQKLKAVWRKEEIAGTAIELGFGRLIRELKAPGAIADLSMIISAMLIFEEIYKSCFEDSEELSASYDSVFRSIVYVNSNLGEDMTELDVARRFNMSYSHFSREFKRATGETFKQYIMRTRINHAEQLLVNTDLSVNEIALRCGYNNISYFISLYKKFKGKTPLQDKKKTKN